MKLNQIKTNRASSTGMVLGTLGLLLLMALILPLSVRFFTRPINRTANPIPNSIVQEKVGYRAVVLARFDQERQFQLQQKGEEIFQQTKAFVNGQPGRLQEILGQSIAQTAQRIVAEQETLRNDLIETKEELGLFNQEKAARWQEKLGQAVLVASRRDPTAGSVFQAAFQQETARLKRVEERTFGRLESELGSLIAEEAQFHAVIPALYQEAVRSAHRVSQMRDESQMTWSLRNLNGVVQGLSWKRLPEDYAKLVSVVRENLKGRHGMGGYVEYGFAALAGLLLAMVWVGATILIARNSKGPIQI